MAIQNRRGNYEDFNPSKLLPGEFALSLDDPKLFMGLGGGNNKQIPFLDDANKRYVLVNQGTQNAGKILEVALDGTLKLIPKPASGGSENILDITFATLGFDSGAGLDKESDAYVEPPRTIFNQVYNHNGAIRLTFSNGDTIVLAKSIEKTKDNPNYWTAEWYAVVQNYIQGNPNYVFYKLIFRKLDYMARWYRFDMNTGGSGSGGSYVLPKATANTLGGVKADRKTSNDIIPAKIGSDGKLYVEKYITVANSSALGGIKADNKGAEYTVPVKIGEDNKLYVPTYPEEGSGGSDILEVDFHDLGFSSEQGLDKGTGQYITSTYEKILPIRNHKGDIKLNFGGGAYLTLYKSYEKGISLNWSCVISDTDKKYKHYMIFYNFSVSTADNDVFWTRVIVKSPCNYSLTFTGGATGKYDGSEDVTINIPTDGGTGGTTDYSALTSKPQINGHELVGNQTAEQLNLQPKGNYITQHQDISGKLDKNQGSQNNGKILGIDAQGNVVPVVKPSGGDTGGNTYTEGIWEHTANIIFKEETTKSKEITVDKDANELNIEDIYLVIRNFQAPQDTQLKITLYDIQNGGVKEFSVFKKDKTDETLITLEKFDDTYKMTSAVGQYDYFESFADQTGKVYVNDGSSTGIFKKINKIQVSFNKTGSNSAYIYIYKKNKVASTGADTQAIVQDVLNALPTWNGGEY